MPRLRKITRNEDMSRRGRLAILIQEDGDIIVAIEPDPDEHFRERSVEFCSVGSGGGRSPHTRKALMDLWKAIEKDNRERPIEGSECEDFD